MGRCCARPHPTASQEGKDMRSWRWLLAGLVFVAAGLFLLDPAVLRGQQIKEDGFEVLARGPAWKAAGTDANPREMVHELTTETAHGGQRSEHIRVKVEKGTFVHYTYDIPRAPITDELTVSLWLKSNRPGVQLLCRIVLPRERDPANLEAPLTTLVRCEPYQSTRWKLIDLRQPVKRLREQKQLLTARIGREVDTTDAYIDQLVLNLHDGTGDIDVWIDDLLVGPVIESKAAPALPVARSTPGATAGQRRGSEVQVQGNQLRVGGKQFLLRGIRYTGTPLRTLRDAGFNTVWLDESTPPGLIEDAVNLGFMLVPSIQPPEEGGAASIARPASDVFGSKVARFLEQDSVLAWDLGSNLSAEQFSHASQLARAFRAADPQRPVLVDVYDGYRGFSRSFEQLMLGTHRWPLFTSMELSAYRDWLVMRRQLSVDNYSWTWIQTHLPAWYTRLVYERDDDQGFKEPVGPMPEQIRLLTYCALAAGYRGLAFWSDRYLADSHQGRDRLLALALLNQELRLLEPILTRALEAPEILPTNHGDVQAAVIRTPKAVLVLPIWSGSGAQYCPGQSALGELHVTVPVMNTATAWEISPGRIRSYPVQRIQGGSQVKLHNFSLTSALLFTSDLSRQGLVVQLQEQQRRMGRLAAQWLCDQAREELTKVEKVFTVLMEQGNAQPDGPALLRRAREALERAQRHRRNGEHTEAYSDAEVTLRALRLLMRAHWNRAVRDLDSPVASPYALSYFTLPRHWELLAQLKTLRAAASVLPQGDFELPPAEVQPGWELQEERSLDPVEVRCSRVVEAPHGGKQCLKIEVKAKDPRRVPAALERTYVAIHSPAVRVQPGSLVRVSAWVKTGGGIAASTDGAMIYDSVGGEPLAVRITNEPKWKRYSLYRRVPASGTVRVTLAMSGLGTVYFDDVRIQPLTPAGLAGDTPKPGNARPTTLPPANPRGAPGSAPAPVTPGTSPARAVRGVSGS
jgi:hypothetical protein